MPNLNGYIKLHRSILNWEWYSDSNTSRVFIHLLALANFKDSEWHGILVKRGQVVIGRNQISQELGISQQSVRTALKHLKSTGEITIESTNRFSLITIVKYDVYQGSDSPTNQQSGQQASQQLTGNQPATNQQLTTAEEQKNVRMGSTLRNEDDNAVINEDQKILCLFKHYGMPVSGYAREKMAALLNEYGENRVETALEEAARSNTSSNGISLKFFEAVLRRDGKHSHSSYGGDNLPWRE